MSDSNTSRPTLPPPSHLDPPFTPRSPQRRPLYSDLPPQRGLYGLSSRASHDRQWPAQSNPMPPRLGAPANSSLPPIFPRNTAYHDSVPATTYEPTSPVEAMSHEIPGRNTLFDDSSYNAASFQPSLGQSQHTPVNPYYKAKTSPNGLHLAGPHIVPSTAALLKDGAESTSSEDQAMLDRYMLRVRQQPQAARACGFGERDRRVLDPPAVVDLVLKDYDPNSPADVEELKYPFHIVHCSLFTVSLGAEEKALPSDVTSVPDPSKVNAMCRRLMGTLVASPFVGWDPEATPSSDKNATLGCFFIFPDLSIRQTGKYRLHFKLMKVSMHNMIEGGQSPVSATVDSDIFEVFAAGNFPGMSPSSLLIRELKKQGATVSLKKGAPSRQKRGGYQGKQSADDTSETGEASSRRTKSKKQRS